MRLNANFGQRVVVHSANIEWVSSPIVGVERRMLDRVGDEVARATSVVRYAPKQTFSSHVHHGGEEFYVLEGTFEDEHGAYPKGTYVRNPPGSSHTPWSDGGCTIFVKLWQFEPSDRQRVVRRAAAIEFLQGLDGIGVESARLFADVHEDVRLERWKPGTQLARRGHPGGIELFVIDGDFEEADVEFTKHSWLRLPTDATMAPKVGPNGATVWIKCGHLLAPVLQAQQCWK